MGANHHTHKGKRIKKKKKTEEAKKKKEIGTKKGTIPSESQKTILILG